MVLSLRLETSADVFGQSSVNIGHCVCLDPSSSGLERKMYSHSLLPAVLWFEHKIVAASIRLYVWLDPVCVCVCVLALTSVCLAYRVTILRLRVTSRSVFFCKLVYKRHDGVTEIIILLSFSPVFEHSEVSTEDQLKYVPQMSFQICFTSSWCAACQWPHVSCVDTWNWQYRNLSLCDWWAHADMLAHLSHKNVPVYIIVRSCHMYDIPVRSVRQSRKVFCRFWRRPLLEVCCIW